MAKPTGWTHKDTTKKYRTIPRAMSLKKPLIKRRGLLMFPSFAVEKAPRIVFWKKCRLTMTVNPPAITPNVRAELKKK